MKHKVTDYLIYVLVFFICIFTSFRFPRRILRHDVSFVVAKDLGAFIGTFIGFTGCMIAIAWLTVKVTGKGGMNLEKRFSLILLLNTVFFGLIFCFGPEFMFKLLRKFF